MTRTPPPPAPIVAGGWSIASTRPKSGQRVVIYGGGGKGKTSLAASLPNPVFIFLGSERFALDVPNISGVKTFEDLLAVLTTDSLWKGVEAVVIDSATVAEAFAVEYTLRTVKTEKGMTVSSVEGYGYGKGYRFVLESFRKFLAAMDRLAERGLHVVLTAHETVDKTPNPAGDDYSSAQPNLMQKGEGKIRDLVRDWCDHLLYIGYDVAVDDGKGKSSGTRCIYTQERASWWAKCRSDPSNPVPFSIVYELGSDLVWKKLGIKKG